MSGIPKLPGYMGSGVPLREKLQMLSIALSSDPEVRAQLPALMYQQRALADRDAASHELDGLFTPKVAPPALPRGALPGDEASGPPQIPMKPDAQGGVPSLHDPSTIQALLKAKRSHVDIAPYVSLLQAGEKPPIHVEGTNGIYERGDNGWKLVQPYPEKEPPVSPGWERQPDGSWAPVKNGPYDPDYIAKAAGVRRDQVISRPMPSRARPSGSAKMPWQKKWGQ